MSTEQTSALETIRKMAMEHHCFDADCFERRDIDALVAKGGDICDWTMVAIHADAALRDPTRDEDSPNASGFLEEAARKHDLRAVICEFRYERMKSLVHRCAAAFLRRRIAVRK